MKKKVLKTTFDMLYFVVGAIIYSVAVNMFLSSNGISPGGFTGVAAIINYLTKIPTGFLLFVLNVPVLILGLIKMGGMFVFKTSFVTVIMSIALDITAQLLPPFKTDGILASLFGGILMGLGLSLVMLRGATTGGVDIIAKLINRRYRHLSVGKIILTVDSVVVALTAFVYKNAESALYSVVAIYTATRVMDILLYGSDRGKIIYAITDHPNLICREINNTVGRGVTRITVVGGYTGESRTMLMCTVRAHQAAAVHDAICQHDNHAFIVVCDAGEIIGEGFKEHS